MKDLSEHPPAYNPHVVPPQNDYKPAALFLFCFFSSFLFLLSTSKNLGPRGFIVSLTHDEKLRVDLPFNIQCFIFSLLVQKICSVSSARHWRPMVMLNHWLTLAWGMKRLNSPFLNLSVKLYYFLFRVIFLELYWPTIIPNHCTVVLSDNYN